MIKNIQPLAAFFNQYLVFLLQKTIWLLQYLIIKPAKSIETVFFYILIFFVAFIPTNIQAAIINSSFSFPHQEYSLGFFNKDILPDNIPHPPHPLFWTSRLKVDKGWTFNYEYTAIHTIKYFSIDIGYSISKWNKSSQSQFCATFLIAFKWWMFHVPMFHPYFVYSVASPSIITRRRFAGANLSANFIFQDFIGVGFLLGEKTRVDVSLKIYHYSNGDLFLHNAGFDVPSVLSVGIAF